MICYPDTAIWGTTDWDQVEDEKLLALRPFAEAFAWASLQALTGNRLAICPITVRPCHQRCVGQVSVEAGMAFIPYIGANGSWFNHVAGCGCDAARANEVYLPGPVGGIVEVVIDGVPLAPSSYRIDNGNRLVRQDGGTFPAVQHLERPIGEVGTFHVSYFHGFAPDSLAAYAAGLLAEEFYANAQGLDCQLPSNVIAITRQGVSYDLATSAFEPGQTTGVREVDAYVARLNPYKLKSAPTIMSVDSLAAAGRVTTLDRRP